MPACTPVLSTCTKMDDTADSGLRGTRTRQRAVAYLPAARHDPELPSLSFVDAPTLESPSSYHTDDSIVDTYCKSFVCSAIHAHKTDSCQSRCVVQQYRSVIVNLSSRQSQSPAAHSHTV